MCMSNLRSQSVPENIFVSCALNHAWIPSSSTDPLCCCKLPPFLCISSGLTERERTVWGHNLSPLLPLPLGDGGGEALLWLHWRSMGKNCPWTYTCVTPVRCLMEKAEFLISKEAVKWSLVYISRTKSSILLGEGTLISIEAKFRKKKLAGKWKRKGTGGILSCRITVSITLWIIIRIRNQWVS